MQRCAVLGGLNANAKLELWRRGFHLLLADVDRKGTPIWLDPLRCQVPLSFLAFNFNTHDVQIAVNRSDRFFN